MGERTPPGDEGFGPTPETIEHMLSDVRRALGMDVAFVSEFAADELVFRAIEGDSGSFGWREGQSFRSRQRHTRPASQLDLFDATPGPVPEA